MSSLIADYEDEFTTSCETVKRDLATLRATFPGADGPAAGEVNADRPAANRAIATLLRRMRDVLSNLEIEATQAPPDVRVDVKGRLVGYKAALAGLEKEAAAAKKQSADADRQELLRGATTSGQKAVAAAGAGATAEDAETLRMKQQMATNTQLMRNSTGKLRDAERLTYEMNDLADGTLEELEKQRGTIRGIGDTVRATDEELSHVQRILRKMHREMLKNKLMLSGIIALLLIMIIGILYYKFGRNTATHSDAASGVSGGGSGSHDVPTAPPPTGPNSWMPTMPPAPTPPPTTTTAAPTTPTPTSAGGDGSVSAERSVPLLHVRALR